MQRKNKNIVIVCHRNLPQPDDDLVIYLNNKKYDNVLHIKHSFSDAKDRCSYYFWYQKGKLFKEKRTKDYSFLPEPLIYLKEFFFTMLWIYTSHMHWDKYIGMDGLNSLYGLLLRFFHKTNVVIFWVMDLVPTGRFSSSLKNSIYNSINTFIVRQADEVWDDLGEQRIVAREKFFGIKRTEYKKHKVVPFGIWTERIKHFDYEHCEKNTLVFMGHLIEKQGVQFVIKALPTLLKRNPKIIFKIIGSGKYEENLKKLAKDLRVVTHCTFLGKIEKNEDLEKEIAKSALALAPYVKELDTFSYYGDNGKIKVYLGCGVPVLLTDVSWLGKEVEKYTCGKVIQEDTKSITESVLTMLKPHINQKYRKNATIFSQKFNYNILFSNLL